MSWPLFLVAHAVGREPDAQLLLLPILVGQSLLSLILSNTLYALAFSIYFYVTHVGYRCEMQGVLDSVVSFLGVGG